MYNNSLTIEEFNLLEDEDKIKIFTPITKCNKCTLEDGRITYEDLKVGNYHWDNYYSDNAKKTKVVSTEPVIHEKPIEFAIQEYTGKRVVFNTDFNETDDNHDYPEIYEELLKRDIKHAFYEGYIKNGIFYVTEAGPNRLAEMSKEADYSSMYSLAELFVGDETQHVKMAPNLYIGTDLSEVSKYKNSKIMIQLGS